MLVLTPPSEEWKIIKKSISAGQSDFCSIPGVHVQMLEVRSEWNAVVHGVKNEQWNLSEKFVRDLEEDCEVSFGVRFVGINRWGNRKVGWKILSKPKNKRILPYSKGDLNRLIDKAVHPLYRKNELFRVLDGLMHGIVEQDPLTSTKKFVIYNLPDLIKKASKRNRRRDL